MTSIRCGIRRDNSFASSFKWIVCRIVSCIFLLCASIMLANAQPVLSIEPVVSSREENLRIEVLEGTLKQIANRGSIRLAYRRDARPFSYLLPDRGQPLGYSIDICLDIAHRLSSKLDAELPIEWVPVTAQNRFETIEKGLADIECGVSSNTPERAKKVSFSAPVFITGARILVPSASKVRMLRDLDRQPVAVVAGSTATTALQKIHTDARLVSFSTYPEAFEALQKGQVSALVGDEVLLYGLLDEAALKQQYRVVGSFITHDMYGLVYQHNDPQMADFLSTTLNHLAEQRDLYNYYTRWFLKTLPGGGRVGIPMSLELDSAFHVMANEARQSLSGR